MSYYAEIAQCNADLRTVQKILRECNKASKQVSEVSSDLTSLGTSVTASIKLEDPGSFQTALRGLADPLGDQVEAIRSACAVIQSNLETDISFYEQQNAAEESAAAQRGASGGSGSLQSQVGSQYGF